tara:strand:+ start:460 stop:726 length:267 start_codon:yes stop_codon:yes gene_type:complete
MFTNPSDTVEFIADTKSAQRFWYSPEVCVITTVPLVTPVLASPLKNKVVVVNPGVSKFPGTIDNTDEAGIIIHSSAAFGSSAGVLKNK